MNKGLVLYSNGTYEVLSFRRTPSDYLKKLNCETAFTLNTKYSYDDNKPEQLRAYSDGEQWMKNLPINLWGPILTMFGFKQVLRGDIILVSLDKKSNDAAISVNIVNIIQQFSSKSNCTGQEMLSFLCLVNNKIKIC